MKKSKLCNGKRVIYVENSNIYDKYKRKSGYFEPCCCQKKVVKLTNTNHFRLNPFSLRLKGIKTN